MYSGTTSASSQSLTNTGTKLTTSRPATLINSTTGAYHTVVPPTYTDYPLARVLNAKAVPSDPVLGDGKTDDMASLQAIITSAAQADQLLFFPQGTYILTDTLQLPPGGRLVGEAWTRLTPRGAKFKDAKNPRPMVRVGQPGDVGVAQMTDFLFYPTGSKEDVNLPRLVMVEVNMAGARPGDVGVFNSHFLMVGGTARLCAHFTETASVYWENSWATAQDNSVSGLGFGGEFLVEARGGTWMVGVETGESWCLCISLVGWAAGKICGENSDPGWTEHHVLYQLNFHNAKDVFVGLEQGEGPYWHGQGNTPLPPAPFANSLRPSDPDFSWCPADDAECRMALYQHVTNSTGVNLYGGAFWNFRAGASQSLCTGDCQTNTVLYENNQKLYSYGIGTINDKNMVLETGPGGNAKTVAAVRDANFGFPLSGFTIHWPAFVAAYLRQSV